MSGGATPRGICREGGSSSLSCNNYYKLAACISYSYIAGIESDFDSSEVNIERDKAYGLHI